MIAGRIAALSLFLVACGGGSTVTPPPPPPPPPPPTPATVGIEAGDQQTAPGQAPVAVAPAVVVRDGQGRPMSGVSVQFTVAAGGGSVEGGSPTTDAAGVARVTSWRLGPSGDQRLSAAVGALAPVVFQATILPGTQVIDVAIGGGGGTFEITEPSHPYRGFKLTVPAGTFSTAATWQVRVRTNPTLPTLPAGYQVAGPVLEVATDQPRGARLMTLDVPTVSAAGKATVIAFYDPARGTMEVMPTVARSVTSIRVMTGHLRGDLLLGRTVPAALSSAASRAVPVGWIIPVDIPIPTPPVPVLANLANLRWPVREHGSAQMPGGHGPAIAAFEATNLARNLAALSSVVKPLSQPGFYAEPGPLAALLKANQSLAAGLSASIAQLNGQLGQLSKPERDFLVHLNLTANLSLRGVTPAVYTGPTGASSVFANVVGSSSDDLALIISSLEGNASLKLNSGSGFGSTSVHALVGGASQTVDGLIPLPELVRLIENQTAISEVLTELLRKLHEMSLLPIGQCARVVAGGGRGPSAVQAVSAGTCRAGLNRDLAVEAGLPVITVEQEAVPGGGWELAEDGELVVRSRTATIRLPGVAGGIMLHLSTSGAEAGRTDAATLVVGAGAALDGQIGSTPTPVSVSSFVRIAGQIKQVSVQVIQVILAPYRVAPDTVAVAFDELDVEFTATVPSPPKSGYRIKWDWGDGTTSETANSLEGTHTYTTAADYQVISTLLASGSEAVLAVDTVAVDAPAVPFWRITSFADADDLLGHIDNGSGEEFQAFQRVIQNPTAGMISIEQNGGVTELRLRAKQAGVWSANDCCPVPGYNPATEWKLPLGFAPAVSHPVGPFFAGWGTSFWTQSTQELDSGTLTGQYVPRLLQYQIHDQGTQTGPGGGFRISATRNGNMMTGEITVHVWLVDVLTTGEVSGTRVSHLPFTAVRIR